MKITKYICALALSCLVGAAQAASVTIDSLGQVGSSISFRVNVNFTGTPTNGGEFLLSYDTNILGDASFAYNSDFFTGSTSMLSTGVDDTTSGFLKNIGFDASSYVGPGILGTVTFSVLNTVAALVASAEDDPFYAFINDTDSSNLGMNYGSASLQVSAVPVPAAVWLMASGLLGMVGLSRRA